MIKKKTPLLFIALIIGVSFLYNYNEIIFKRPQSVHQWRQSDCASIALNYYQGRMNFFRPETHNLTSDSGTTGKCLTSEIPILYYSVAALYSVFGYHDYIYRIFNTLLFFLGLFYLSRLLYYLLKDTFWAVALMLLFFTSPVLVFYGNNYLTNSSALAFSIIGWYYFIRFFFERKSKWFYISMAVFLLAAAFKVTALFSLVAIAGIYLMELTGLLKLNENKSLFNKPLRFAIPIIAIFVIIVSWLVYANSYNKEHDCFYFSTTTFPIWTLSEAGIHRVIDNVRNLWIYQYFHISVLSFLVLCFLFILFYFKKNYKFLIFSILIIFAEAIVYVLLQFMTFADHDYYTIEMFILPILIVISTFDVLKRHFNKIFSSIIFKLVFSIFLIFNIYYASRKINERYNGWMNDYSRNSDIHTITPYLRQLGIEPADTVISIPDYSHATLYLMNQKGWTEYSDARFNRGERIYYNNDSAAIQHSINKGAKYLILNRIEELYTKTYLQTYCTNLIGRYNNVLVFNLRSKEKNFNINQRVIKKIYRCNAEMLSKDQQSFVSDNDSTITFQNIETRSDEFAHSGKYSSKLSESQPYGMTIKINDLKFGESFSINAWRKTEDKSKGALIISAGTPNKYYNNEFIILDTVSNGWDNLHVDIFIRPELVDEELVIYLFNPDPKPVYFDDFEIIRYKSILDD